MMKACTTITRLSKPKIHINITTNSENAPRIEIIPVGIKINVINGTIIINKIHLNKNISKVINAPPFTINPIRVIISLTHISANQSPA
jgi:hypothetical protein